MAKRHVGAVLALLLAPAAFAGTVPGQFIAKIYSEALGRAPDSAGWISAVQFFAQNSCDQAHLASWGESVFASPEFQALGYGPPELGLVLYRTVLDREPDAGGYAHTLAQLEQSQDFSSLVTQFFNSDEFAQLVPYICSGGSYSFAPLGNNGSAAVTVTNHSGGSGGLSEQELQALLDSTPSGGTVYLQQGSVVLLTEPLRIPSGVSLATYALPAPNRHALMARLVRAAPFAAPMIEMHVDADPNPAGALRNLWIDGERTAASVFVPKAIDVEIYGGNGIVIDSNFIANSLGWSSLHSYGSLDGRPCGGHTITNNVITVYPSVHADGQWTDGLSLGCEATLAQGNQIIDATDVGIVVFTAYPATQASQVSGNTVVSAGNSAFAALAFDPLQGRSPAPPDFSGAAISNNTLWSSPSTHFIIGLAVGSRPWYASGSVGHGASMIGNTTAAVPTAMGAGIVVSGMLSATVQSNSLERTAIPASWSACPMGNVLASVSAGLASGNLQAYEDVASDGCMSDYSPDNAIDPANNSTQSQAPRWHAIAHVFGVVRSPNVTAPARVDSF